MTEDRMHELWNEWYKEVFGTDIDLPNYMAKLPPFLVWLCEKVEEKDTTHERRAG